MASNCGDKFLPVLPGRVRCYGGAATAFSQAASRITCSPWNDMDVVKFCGFKRGEFGKDAACHYLFSYSLYVSEVSVIYHLIYQTECYILFSEFYFELSLPIFLTTSDYLLTQFSHRPTSTLPCRGGNLGMSSRTLSLHTHYHIDHQNFESGTLRL